MGAAEKGHALVVERLLTAGAKKDMENNVGFPQPSPPARDQEDDEPR